MFVGLQSALTFYQPSGSHNLVMGPRFLESFSAPTHYFRKFSTLDQDRLGCDIILSGLCYFLFMENSYTFLRCFLLYYLNYVIAMFSY